MKQRRWGVLAGTEVQCSWRRVVRSGVAVLLVRLRGASGDRADDVAAVVDALDALGSRVEGVSVSVLDTRGFSNAYGDEAGILTSVFAGLPCCWVSSWWQDQVDGRRWDLPPSERLAGTTARAIERAVGWRLAGGFSLRVGSFTREHRWTERGLVATSFRGGALDMVDVFHRNRLVERAMPERDTLVLLPFADATGVEHDGLRLGARVVLRGGQIVEVDFSPWQTGRPLARGWVERLGGLVAVEELVLLGAGASDDEIVAAARALPSLRELRLDRERIAEPLLGRLRGARPGLRVR